MLRERLGSIGRVGAGFSDDDPLVFHLFAEQGASAYLTPVTSVVSTVTPPASVNTDRFVEDHESVIRRAVTDEFRFRGARRVHNLYGVGGTPEDAISPRLKAVGTSPPSFTDNVTFLGRDCSQVTFTVAGGSGMSAQRIEVNQSTTAQAATTVVGMPLLTSCEIAFSRVLVGSETIALRSIGNEWLTAINIGAAHAGNTGGWVRFAFGDYITTAGNQYLTVLPNSTLTDEITVYIRNVMYQEKSITSAPDDFLDPTLDYDVGGANAIKYFLTTNGNSVSNNVVTEAAGTALGATYNGYMAEPAGTNSCLQSEDFSTTWVAASTTVTASQATAPDGRKTATDIKHTADDQVIQAITITADTTTCVSVFVHDGTTGAHDWIQLRWQDHAAANGIEGWFNIQTGAKGTVQAFGTGTALTASGVDTLANGWYRIWISGTLATGITAGSFRIKNVDADASSTVETTNSSWIWGAQCEKSKPVPTSYIKTTTVAVTRAADIGMNYSLSNWTSKLDTIEGSMEFEFTPLYEGQGALNAGIVTPRATSAAVGLYQNNGAEDVITIRDGTNAQSLTNVWSAVGQTITVKGRWNTALNELNLSVDGTAATATAFAGTFAPDTNIRLFQGGDYGMCVKNVKLYAQDKGDAWLAT